MKIGDAVRLRPESDLRELPERWADEVWKVALTHQDDDDDGLRISIALSDPSTGHTSPLPANEFDLVRSNVAGQR